MNSELEKANRLALEKFQDVRKAFPERRSSALFPIALNLQVKTYVSFLSYWKLKNDLEAEILLTIRDHEGKTIASHVLNPRPAVAYRLAIETLISDTKVDQSNELFQFASLEVEVFTSNQARFAYPAILYEVESGIGNEAFGVVHSCSRTLNNNEAYDENLWSFPQTGFDIEFTEQETSFLTYIKGNSKSLVQGSISFQNFLDQSRQAVINEKFSLLRHGYQPVVFNLSEILKKHNAPNGLYKCSIKHDEIDVFPRFFCGRFSSTGSITGLTHSFFDTSDFNINTINPGYLDGIFFDANSKGLGSSMALPIPNVLEYDTSLVSYDSSPKCAGLAKFSFYSANDGELIGSVNDEIGQILGLHKINLSSMLKDFSIGNKPEDYYTIVSLHSDWLPRRIKFGFNISRINSGSYHQRNNKLEHTGTNICFAPQAVVSVKQLEKPFARNWGPIGGPNDITVFYFVGAPFAREHANRSVYTDVKVCIHASDGILFEKLLKLEPERGYYFRIGEGYLQEICTNEPCWIFFEASWWSGSGFFFSTVNQNIGGDHLF